MLELVCWTNNNNRYFCSKQTLNVQRNSIRISTPLAYYSMCSFRCGMVLRTNLDSCRQMHRALNALGTRKRPHSASWRTTAPRTAMTRNTRTLAPTCRTKITMVTCTPYTIHYSTKEHLLRRSRRPRAFLDVLKINYSMNYVVSNVYARWVQLNECI